MDVLTERTANIELAPDDDDEEDYLDDGDEDEQLGNSRQRSSKLKDRRMSTKKSSRRRRRSSARFLKLGGAGGGDEDDGDGDDGLATNTENLGEVYQKAIRMNAENRINASNSWNLNLIDHMDRFLATNVNSAKGGASLAVPVAMEDTLGPLTGVNFTKASCTLDASVKIYSYRVDDVHLTSYKVLANLNRTETTGKSKKSGTDGEEGAGANAESGTTTIQREGRRKAAGNTETLESNLANINIHKLDAAFDIDPLFHKMSKTFDEGGAKGLLLANLGVSATGCNIVFDSTLDHDGGETNHAEEEKDENDLAEPYTMVDITSLTAKLESSLNGQTVHDMPLVPQLAPLRSDFAQLKQDGFVQNVKPSERYAAPQEDEMEAERSIHVEAIERSRASQADLGRSMMAEDDDASTFSDDDRGGYASDDFGGGDDDGDAFPVSFSMHDGDHRFSSDSFQTTFEASQPPSQATVLLDAIAAGDISGSQSNYEYFNRKALETIQGNTWAGAAHWKKIQPKRKPKTTADIDDSSGTATTPSKKGRKGRTDKTKAKGTVVVDISAAAVDLKDLMRKPPKGKKGSNPLQMTKAAISKATKNENLLPLDAGIKVQSLTSLFLRPNTNVMDFSAAKSAPPTRNVGFGGVETWGADDDNSFGRDDDGGFGYNFGGGDDNHHDNDPGEFVVPELEGVRKVRRDKVGYATVAKKVDVRRLKQDLWSELDRTFQERGQSVPLEEMMNYDEDLAVDDDVDVDARKMEGLDTKDETTETTGGPEEHGPLSFQETVKEMQTSQSQSDVTLPFYFICILHLANEKGLALESTGLEDFAIRSS